MTRKSWKDLVDQPVKAEAQDEGLDTVPSLDEVATSNPVLSKLMKEQAKLKQNMDQVLKAPVRAVPLTPDLGLRVLKIVVMKLRVGIRKDAN